MYHINKESIGNGENIALQNTATHYFKKFDILGNSKQEGIPSINSEAPIESVGDNINLFDISTVSNQIINSNTGAITSNSSWRLSEYIEVEPFVDYMFSWKSSSHYFQLRINMYDKDKTYLETIKYELNNTYSKSFKTIENCKYIRVNYSVNVSGTEAIRENIKLEKGTKATPYSPYGQGSIEIYNGNKNLFNKDTVIQNSFIGANGGIATQEGIFYSDYIFVKENEYINISGRGDWRSFALYDKNKTFIKRDSVASDNTSYLIPTGCKYIRINGEMSNIDIIQVEEGINQTDFVAHQSQTKFLYTQQPFRAIGEVKDRFVKKAGVWYEEHNIGLYTFTGNEIWYTNSNWANKNAFFSTLGWSPKVVEDFVTKANLMCNYFKVYTPDAISRLSGSGIGQGGGKAVYISVEGITTISDLKTWLSTNNVELYYELETPTLIECTPEQVEVLEYLDKEIKSYDEQTNISSTDAISPIFDVTAYQRISEEFKTRLKEGKITRGYLKVLATDTLPELIIDENNYLKDLKIEELRYVPEEGFIGGAVAKRVTGNFNNVDNSFDIQDREVEVYLGVELEDETTEYIKYGTYIVQRPEDDQVNDNTSFEALDYMVKFNQKYKDRITYPCKLKELLNDVLDQAGVNSKVNTFANSDFIVENNQFEQGTTLRDAIKAIAQMAFNWARIDEDDNFVMDFEMNENIDEELGTDDYFSFKKSDDYGPVNVVVLRNSQVEGENVTIKDEESILQHGEIEYVISDNPFAYTELKRKQLIEAGRRLFGLRYTPMTVDMLGLMYLNAKDRISVENSNGEKFNTYLLDHTIDYTGIVLDSMQSQAKTKTETKYQYISSLAQGLSQVEIKVDKANKKIESIVQTQEDVSEKVAKTVARIEVVYALSDSPTTAPTEGWSTTAPEWTAGKYMWQKTITTYANGTTAETAATNISGAKGEAGQNGIGITQTNITYQKSTSGTTVPTGTWQTTIPEVNEDGYLWTRTEFIYSDGSKKYAYNVGKKGATGIGVKSLVDQYYLSTSNTEQTGGEWTETQPEWQDKTYIWTRTKINWTDNSITYTDPVLANTLNDINSNIVVLQEFKSSQITTNTSITNSVSDVTRRLNNDYSTTEQVDSKINGLDDKYEILEGRVAKTELSSEDFKISIETIKNQGVDKITTSMGYTFNDNGLNINRDNADTGTIVDEAGIQVVDKTGAGDPTDILYAGYVKEDNTKYADYAGQTIVATSNLIVKNFLVIGSNSRFQDYTNPILGGQGTGVYDI